MTPKQPAPPPKEAPPKNYQEVMDEKARKKEDAAIKAIKYNKGGSVRGAGCATKGVKKARMY